MPARRLSFAVIACAAVTSAAPPTSGPADAFARLGDADPAVREQAFAEVWAAGDDMRARLITEADTGNLEKRARCQRLLTLLDLGLPATVPPAAVEAVLSYDYDSPEDVKRRLVRAAAPAAAASPALLKMGVDEPSPVIRRIILGQSGRAVGPYLDRLAKAGSAARADLEKFVGVYVRLIGPNAAPTTADVDFRPALVATAVTIADQNGRLDAEIASLRAEPNRSGADQTRLQNMLVAAGRDAEALAAAEEFTAVNASPRRFDVIALRLRTGDWRGAVRFNDETNFNLTLRIAGRLVFGDDAGARDLSRSDPPADRTPDIDARRDAARRNLLAGRVKEGVDQFAGVGEVGVLRLQSRWAEALKLGQMPALPPDIRQRQRDAQEALRREAGEAPQKPRTPAPVPAPPSPLQPAADAYGRGDFTAALAAVDLALVTLSKTTAEDYTARAAALWLRADCLDRTARPADAKAVRDAADLHAVARYTAAVGAIAALDAVGLYALADTQAARLLRRQPDNAWLNATLAERTMIHATRNKQWAVAARAADEMLLWHALGNLTFVDPVGDMRGPYRRRVAHARAALAEGKPEVAVAHLHVAVTYLPIASGVATEFVPQLIAAGRRAAADELFDRVWTKQADLCRQYPKAASLRNSAAWMALRCDRRLDEALALATAAAKMMPENDAILDTYAEALFRSGKKEEALATMRRAVALRPGDAGAIERLRGFEQGRIVVPPEPE